MPSNPAPGTPPCAAVTTLDRAALFALLWAVAILVHQADEDRFATLGVDPVLIVAAVAVLLRPTSATRVAALCLVQVLAAAIRFPYVTNHWALVTAVDAMVLAAIPSARGGGHPHGDIRRAVFATVAAPARAALVLVYAFAALAKLNTDFLDPDLSCAPYLYGNVVALVPALPVPSAALAIWATIVIEIAVATLLLHRRTWRIGLMLAGAFHLLLALAGFYEFAAVAFALYMFFLPSEAGVRVPAALGSERRGTLPTVLVATALLYAVLHASRLDAVTTALPALAAGSATGRFAGLLWLPLGTATLAVVVRRLRPHVEERSAHASWRVAAPAWAIVALVAVNGAAPYLGLKTEAAYTMFSNLRTEGTRWNHLVIPVGVRLFELQNDLVRPLDASDDWLRARARDGDRVVFFTFHHYVSRRPDLRVRYERAGRVHDVEHVGADPVLSRPVPYLARKLLWFKPVPPDGRNTCQH
jgi:hypothetical protein